MNKTLIVTGGAGFIGKYFCKKALDKNYNIYCIDNLSYAADIDYLEELKKNSNFSFHCSDINFIKNFPPCDYIVNFAAESHVDNSLGDNASFIKSNVLGVQHLLELIRRLPNSKEDTPIFYQISTDEVYGDIKEGSFLEEHCLNPNNPYSASKASAEHIVKTWNRCFGINYLITRGCNVAGLRQYPEKLIPRSIEKLLVGKKVLLHGDGSYIRSWISIEKTVEIFLTLIELGVKNEVYNVDLNNEYKNQDIIKIICEEMNLKYEDNVEYISNRFGQDIRYSLNNSKLKQLLNNKIELKEDFSQYIKNTVKNYEKVNWRIV